MEKLKKHVVFIAMIILASLSIYNYTLAHSGTIILLNGSSNSGKSTLADELVKTLNGNFGKINQTMSAFVKKSAQSTIESNPAAVTKLVEHVLRMNYLDKLQTPWSNPTYKQFFDETQQERTLIWDSAMEAMINHIAQQADTGKNIVTEVLFAIDDLFQLAVSSLKNYRIVFVKVWCPLDIVEKRAKKRANRPPEWIRTHFDKTHTYNGQQKYYDITVDTSKYSPKECALQIKEFIQTHDTVDAFKKNYKLIHNIKNTNSRGNIVILNGSSSSGKTTLSQKIVSNSQYGSYEYVSMRNFVIQAFHDMYKKYPAKVEKLWVVFTRPMFLHLIDPSYDSVFVPHKEALSLELEDIKHELLESFSNAITKKICAHIKDRSDHGQDLIVDVMLAYPEMFECFVCELHDYPVSFIKVISPLHETLRREQMRPDMKVKFAEKTFLPIHRYHNTDKIYDFIVNTYEESMKTCAQKICQYVDRKELSSAFRQNYALMQETR